MSYACPGAFPTRIQKKKNGVMYPDQDHKLMTDKENKENLTCQRSQEGEEKGGRGEQMGKGRREARPTLISLPITATPSQTNLPNGTSKAIKFTPVKSPAHYFIKSGRSRSTRLPFRSRLLKFSIMRSRAPDRYHNNGQRAVLQRIFFFFSSVSLPKVVTPRQSLIS